MKNADENGLYNGVYYGNYQNVTKTEKVEVDVPVIDNEKPEEVTVLVNGEKFGEDKVEFDRENSKLTIENNNGTNEAKLTCLVVFEQALKKGIIDTKGIEDIIPSFFASFWNLKSTLDTRIQRHLAPITDEIAKRSTMINVVNYLFNDFKQQPPDYRRLVIETFDHLIDECGTVNLIVCYIYQIVVDLVFAFEVI